jgi:hypothetical protein
MSNGTVFFNNGTVSADAANSDPIRLSLSTASGNQNNGTIQAIGSGTLVLDQGFLDQRGGGTLFADDGCTVTFGANGKIVTIVGGFFKSPACGFEACPPGGLVQANGVAVDGCTNLASRGLVQGISAGFVVPSGGLLVILGGGLTNKGTINVLGGEVRFDASATINGSGTIFLQGSTVAASGVTATFDNSISGTADVLMAADNTVFVNKRSFQGAIRFFLSNSPSNRNDGRISDTVLEQGAIDQSGGGQLFSDDILQIGGGGHSFTVTGGLIQTATPSFEVTPVVQGVAAVLGGDITLGSADRFGANFEIPANDFTLVTATKLTNNGTITLDASTSLLRFDSSTELGGTGAIVLTNNALLEINHSVMINVTNAGPHTITGNGTIQIDSGSTLTNNALISAGTSSAAGTLNVSGDLHLGSNSKLTFKVGGTTQGSDYDVVHKTDNGTLILNGLLAVTMINKFAPIASDTFAIITAQSPVAGAFANAPDGARLTTTDGSGSFVVSYTGNSVVLSNFGPPGPPAQLLNISTRTRVLTYDNVLIGGFIVTGTEPKKVLIRALGPSLPVSGALADPVLELHDKTSTLATNDNWKVDDKTGKSQQAQIAATNVPPPNDRESALIATLPANNSGYTAVVRGKNSSIGIGQVEVYDLSTTAKSQLANISTRGFVETGDNVLIGGFIAGPNPAGNTKVLLRALGPSLPVGQPLLNPMLALYDANGAKLATNNDWKFDDQTHQSQKDEILATHGAPRNDRESAMVRTVLPGNYTAIVANANELYNGPGVALVEVYNLQ